MGSLAVILRVRDAIVATGSGLAPADPRRSIADQSITAVDRRFEVEIIGGRNQRQLFGDGYTTIHFDLQVTTAYFLGGGDAGGGDIKSVNQKAGADQTLICDALLDSRNWDVDTTGIQEITSVNWFRGARTRLNEFWVGAFTVEVRVPWLPV
jgi:hypothetical protein